MSYSAYSPMISAAKRYPALWRLVMGVVTAIALTIVWLILILLLLALVSGSHPFEVARTTFSGPANTPAQTILYLLVVAGLGFATLAAAAIWQKRGRRDLMGRAPVVLRHFALTAGVTLLFGALISSWSAVFGGDAPPVRNLDFGTWLSWLPFALVAIGFQTLAEELFFRGYLQSQLAARFRSPLIWLVVPAIAFGFAHFAPGLPGWNSWFYVAFAAVFGILAGDLTARTGSLGAAWGWHFANNSFAVLIVATEGSVTGLGLWRAQGGLMEPITLSPILLIDLAIIIGIWFVIRRLLKV